MKNLDEMVMEKFAAAPKMAKRYTKADIANSPKPVLVVAYNKNIGTSKMFVKKLDKALTQVQGLERLKIIALEEMAYPQLIKSYGMISPSIMLFKRGKKIGAISGTQITAMAIQKFLNEKKKDLI